MKIFVKAKAGAKKEQVERVDETHYVVRVKAPPVEGEANDAIRKALADYFDVAPSRIKMTSGKTSKQKIFEIVS